MRTLLLSLAMLFSMGLWAQYCGHSSSASCAPDSSLAQPGLTDYHNFPCVSSGVPFSENMQIYVPASISYNGFNATVDSVRIDSITNLPCGLCWSANKPSLTFAANERGCINISGTSTDAAGTYSLGLYGTAYTPFGAFGGSLNTFWGNFYVFVKQPTAACSHGVGTLLTACGGHAPCTFVPQVVQISPATPCTGASAITVGTAAAYQSQMWYLSNDTGYNSTFTWSNNPDPILNLRAIDTAGCTGTLQLVMTSNGAVLAPQICYFTTDTSVPYANVIVAVQRNDAFHTADSYTLFASNTASVSVDTPISTLMAYSQAIFHDTMIHGYYRVAGTYCSGAIASNLINVSYSQYSILTVDSTTSGYPQLSWPLQLPVTYSSIYVLAREQGGSWQVIDSIFGITGTNLQVTYVDRYPTSQHMDYMLGYNLNNTCDPSRSGGKTVFTNAAMSQVRSGLVTTRPGGPNGLDNVGTLSYLEVYPNPTTGLLHIQTPPNSPVTLSLYDMVGNEVYRSEAQTEHTSIDLSGYAQGIYMVKATSQGHQVAVRKVVKD
ncbi:MAG: T9SS type A sorting domain-containing protein [Bacteroidetes bacterium]|nr:T9SS type A sorting domain-containing protein [Bacteroidota bacterium]